MYFGYLKIAWAFGMQMNKQKNLYCIIQFPLPKKGEKRAKELLYAMGVNLYSPQISMWESNPETDVMLSQRRKGRHEGGG